MKRINYLFIALLLSGCMSNNKINKFTTDDYIQSTPKTGGLLDRTDINLTSSITSFKYDRDNFDGLIDIKLFKNEILSFINDIRRHKQYCSEPVGVLHWNYVLEEAATAHVEDLALNNRLKHNGSGTYLDVARPSTNVGSKFYERIAYFGYPVKVKILLGEALAISKTGLSKSNKLYPNFRKSIYNILQDPPHCKIIMNNRFNYIGVGIYKILNKYYFVYDFAQKTN